MTHEHAGTDASDPDIAAIDGNTSFPPGSFLPPSSTPTAPAPPAQKGPGASLPRTRRHRRVLVLSAAAFALAVPLVPAMMDGSEPSATTASTSIVAIPSNFDVSQYIVAGNNGGHHPADVSGEGTWGSGNFRSICNFSHFGYDDPIVYPGQPGKAHLHMFFGNTTTNASSTYASLRGAGDGTCNGRAANRSGYWVPALMTPSGQAVIPEAIATYYKNGDRDPRLVQAFPPGLEMIAGNDMSNPSAPDGHRWYCEAAQSAEQKYLTIPDCPDNQLLIGQVIFPDCWNGVDLDSADHRSHMAYAVRDVFNHVVCPASHPVLLPEVTFTFFFRHVGPTSGWYVSSDRMSSSKPNGSTFHADWFGAWDPGVLDKWVRTCVNGRLDCQQGQLGDDTSLVWAPSYSGPNPVTPPVNSGNNTLLNPTTTTQAPATTIAPTTTTASSTTTGVSTTVPFIISSSTTVPDGSAPSPTPGPQDKSTWIPLRLGSTGEYVRRSQSTLNRIGYLDVQANGNFDQATANAVLAEQKKYGSLADTGTVDWDTGIHLGIFWASDSTTGATTSTIAPSTTGAPATTVVASTTSTSPATTTTAKSTTTTTIPTTTTKPATSTTAFSPAVAKWTQATWKPLTLGSTGEYVRRSQRTLQRIGYTRVTDTGVFDAATFSAVLAEQRKWSSLPDTGTVDWVTGKHLGIFW